MSQSAPEILAELQRRGVIVAVDGDTLCLKPKRALDDMLLARVREAKPAILEALRSRPATCTPACYEAAPGIRIHRPWTGCTAVNLEPSESEHKVAMTCWHENWRRAREIRTQAMNEKRSLTLWEAQQANSHERAALRAMIASGVRKQFEEIEQDAERGPLNWYQIQMLKIHARWGFSGAKDLLEKYSRNSLKKKSFAGIVRMTPRLEGEECAPWVRRIWDQCAKYGTECPDEITEELLQRLSQREEPKTLQHRKINLPANSSGSAKLLKVR